MSFVATATVFIGNVLESGEFI